MLKDQSENTNTKDNTPLLENENESISLWNTLIYRNNNKNNKKTLCLTLLHSLKKSMSNIQNWYIGLQQFGVRVIIYAVNGLWLVSYMRLKYGYSRELSAFVSSLFFMSAGFGSLFSGKMIQYFKRRKVWLIIGVICSAFSLLIIYINNPLPSLFIVVLCNIVSGFGCGFLPVGFAMVRECNDYYNCSDAATGMVNMIGNASGFMAQLIVSNLLDYNWKQRGGNDYNDNGDRKYAIDDYDFGFIIVPISLVAALVLSLIVKETYGENVDYSHKETNNSKSKMKQSEGV